MLESDLIMDMVEHLQSYMEPITILLQKLLVKVSMVQDRVQQEAVEVFLTIRQILILAVMQVRLQDNWSLFIIILGITG